MQFIEHHQDRIVPKDVAFRHFVRDMPEDMALQYSCLENPMDRGAWQATVHGVTKELDMI